MIVGGIRSSTLVFGNGGQNLGHTESFVPTGIAGDLVLMSFVLHVSLSLYTPWEPGFPSRGCAEARGRAGFVGRWGLTLGLRVHINKMVTSSCIFKALISFQVFCLIILRRLREIKN